MNKTIRLLLLAAAAIAVLFAGALTASAAPAQPARGAAGSPADGMFHATFRNFLAGIRLPS